MQGLLDIWEDWKKKNQSYSTGFEDYTETPGSGTLDTAGGVQTNNNRPNGFRTMLGRKDRKPTGQFDFNPFVEGKTNLPNWMISKKAKINKDAINAASSAAKTPNLYKDQIMQGGTGTKQGEDPSWW